MEHLLSVSFELELHAAVRTSEEAEEAAAATAPPGHVAVQAARRKRWGRARAPSVHFDPKQGQEVLSDDADWSEDAFTLTVDGRRRLAATVLALAQVLPAGWGVRVYWFGDPLRGEQTVPAQEHAELVEQSGLDRYTLYRVK